MASYMRLARLKNFLICFGLYLGLLVLLPACSSSDSGKTKSSNDACDKAVAEFAQAIIDGDYQKAYSLTSETTKEEMDYEQFVAEIQLNERDAGKATRWGNTYRRKVEKEEWVDFYFGKEIDEKGRIIPDYSCAVSLEPENGSCKLYLIEFSLQ